MNILLVNHISKIDDSLRVGGVQYHRMIKPHTVLKRMHPEYDLFMTDKITDEVNDIIDQSNIVLFSREIPEDAAELLNKKGIPFGLDLDDYWHLPDYHILAEAYKTFNTSQKIINSIRLAHFIIVTTPILAKKVSEINNNVFVIENGIDTEDSEWQPNKTKSHRLRFGFTQGATHYEDLKLINKSVIKAYSDNKFYKHGQIVLTGFEQKDRNNLTIPAAFEYILTNGLRAIKYEKQHINNLNSLIDSDIDAPYRRINERNVTEFGSVYNDIDISVIPLINNTFNNCKSELKMIEAGFMDCAAMVSNIEPYTLLTTPDNSFNLSTHSFYELQRIILNNPNLMHDKKEQLKLDVQKYSLKNLTSKRKQLYERINSNGCL